MSLLLHDPDATLDYTWDWSGWLGEGDTISDATVTATTGLVVESVTVSSTSVYAVISTTGAIGERHATCRVTSAAGLSDDWTITLLVQQR